MTEETKKCPYCGEEILATAIKCKYCKEWLDKNKKEEDLQAVDNDINDDEKSNDEQYAQSVFNDLIGLHEKTRETVLEKLEKTNGKILLSEFYLLNNSEQDNYFSRINWFSILLYPVAFIGYALTVFFQHPYRNSLILAAMIFFFGNPFSDLNSIVKENEYQYCVKLKVADGEKREFCSSRENDLITFKRCTSNPNLKSTLGYMQMAGVPSSMKLKDTSVYSMCRQNSVYEVNREQEKEEAKKIGVSHNCYCKYKGAKDTYGTIYQNLLPCSKRENEKLKNFFNVKEGSIEYENMLY